MVRGPDNHGARPTKQSRVRSQNTHNTQNSFFLILSGSGTTAARQHAIEGPVRVGIPLAPNAIVATPADYVKATQSVFRSAEQASAVWLPVGRRRANRETQVDPRLAAFQLPRIGVGNLKEDRVDFTAHSRPKF
jgi:hypothetical protein